MIVQDKRPAGLKALVAYKSLVVLVLLVLSIISAFSWRNYDALATVAQQSFADGEFSLADWFLKTVLHGQPQGLRLVARISGIYAIGMGVATAGLWYGKKWATPLMLLLAGLPLPLEVQELMHEASWRRLIILLLNVAVVGYLIKHQISEITSHEQHPTPLS
jgi:uncharacterized membrane protein (DUF2068 family)